jgi:hypothetical protein
VTKKVIYVCFGRLTDKLARDWYIDFLIDKGVEVECWDIVALLREAHSEHGALHPNNLRVFHTLADIRSAVRLPENREALYVMLVTYNGRLARIFRLLSQERCRMLHFVWGTLPRDSTLNRRKIAAWAPKPLRSVQEIFNRAKARALRRFGLVAPFDIVFAAGAVAMAGSNHTRRIVPINYFDYDHYVKAKANCSAPLVAGRYAVFLDSNLPYHSDLAFSGHARINPEAYYRSLNRFFGELERARGIRVVIATHPRADYQPDRFEERPMHRLVTAELVRDAEFVLAHTSTALSYAILNCRPLVFVHTNAMAATYVHSLMRDMSYFATWLDATVCNVDEPDGGASLVVQPPNLKRYERYKYDYLTSRESEGTPTEEIFWREIRAQ